MSDWISVNDRLPEWTDRYLVWVGANWSGTGMSMQCRTATWHYIDKRWFVDHDYDYELVGDVAYWMPLPEPPKEG